MQCAACGFEAPDGLRFCGQCGAALATVCGGCGAPNPPQFRFCGACGRPLGAARAAVEPPGVYTPSHLAAKILTARSSLEGERKSVTVLFADVADFTGLAERLDPEDLHGIVDGCFRLLLDEVHRYEGTVNQFTGDGIMALFGAPIAHENAAERAVRAGLGMQAALIGFADGLARTRGIEFRVRIGIHTGLVVVGKIGDDLRMEYTAIGDTTNLAARLQTAAAPGSVLVSDQTARQVAGRFVMRPVGPLALKGKSEPVPAHEVLRALPRAPLVATEQGLTPLVGRSAELAALETAFTRAAGGRGQVVFVVGEAGIGKSRLIHEFQRRLADRDVTWLEGRCVSFGRAMPFLPVIEAVKGSFGIEEADDDPAIVEKVTRGLDALGPAAGASAPYVRALLALDPGDAAVASMEASARRFATFEALKRLSLATAARRPLVVLIEDLHWIDQASEEYLTYITDALAAARVLLLCTYRPGYRPGFVGERSYLTRIALQPLSEDETGVLAAAMLAAAAVPAEVRAVIAAKADGNPFFIEEITKSLVELGALRLTPAGLVLGRPVSEVVIPDTIQDVIMARIDRLGDAPKRAIQVASVIGREFALRLLQRASDLGPRAEPLLGELRALELIYEKSGVPELAYMFKHALTHDVAYESLLVQRRKELHRLIGHATEELYADRLAEYWETLAHHYYRGEDWPRAFAYLVKAGDKARAGFANGEAVGFYERALEVAAHLLVEAALLAAIHEGKGQAHFALSEFDASVASFEAAIALTADELERARLKADLSQALIWAHRFDAALASAEEALTVARPAGATSVTAHALHDVGFVCMLRGDVDTAEARLHEALTLEAAGETLQSLSVRVFMGFTENWRGDYRKAIDGIEPVRATLREMNQLLAMTVAASQTAITLGGAGEYARALAVIDEGVATAETIGDRVWRARLWNTRGWILGELGAFEPAEEANRRCLEITRQLGSLRMAPELIGNAEANLADAALARGDAAGAEPHLAAVAALLADPHNEWMTWRYGMHHRVNVAEHALARGDVGRAREALTACLVTAERTRSRRYVVRATRLLAACHVAAGQRAEAEALLARAVAAARTLGNPPQHWHAAVAHGRLLHALGRADEAAAAWREARTVVDRVAGGLARDLGAALRRSPIAAALGDRGA